MTSYISLINLFRIMYHHTITMNHFVCFVCYSSFCTLSILTNESIDKKFFTSNSTAATEYALLSHFSSMKIKQTKQIYYWQWDKYMYQLPITHRLTSQKKVHKENEMEWKDVVLCLLHVGFILASSLNSLAKQNKL